MYDYKYNINVLYKNLNVLNKRMRAYSFFEFTYFTHKNEYIVFDYKCN